MIPTGGGYPIATANVKEDISAPLMSRFAVIDIPDYTQEEKKIIFSKFALPKVLKRIGLLQGEIVLTGEGLDELIEQYKDVYKRQGGRCCRKYNSRSGHDLRYRTGS